MKSRPPKPRKTAAPARVGETHNEDIARAFDEVADILEIEGDNPFRVRAYRNAARSMRGLAEEVAERVARGEPLEDLPEIGGDLAAQIMGMLATGHLERLDRLRPEAPALALALRRLQGVGPKRAMAIYEGLTPRPKSFEDVLAACREGRVQKLPGFGPRSERELSERLQADLHRPRRFRLASLEGEAKALVQRLTQSPDVEAAQMAGSFRRRRDSVGDLDIVASSRAPEAAARFFLNAADASEVLASGSTRTSVVLKSGLQVDLRIVPPESYGAALVYFTGSKDHNIALRRRGQQAGLKVNEYGVYRGAKRLAGATETSVYQALRLPYIEPELRENQGEIEAAEHGALPHLVRLQDIKGDLHSHTTASDGLNSLREMAAAAQARGLTYLAVTDHSRRLAMAHGLTEERLLTQINEIDGINGELSGFRLLKGAEVDILDDGALDLPDSVLKRLDVVVVAVHSAFTLPARRQTDRILRAMDNRFVHILAHPTGRLLLEREGYALEMPRLMKGARERGCWLEINAQPSRLDLTDLHCRMAKEEGVLLSLGSNSHRVADLLNLRYGVDQARRGWLEPKDVVNTRSLDELVSMLQARR